MKPEQIFQELKDLAEKLEITVSEQNFRNTGIAVKSGLCKVKEHIHFILDKHLPLKEKTRILAVALNQFPHEDIYVLPAVRETLEKYAGES